MTSLFDTIESMLSLQGAFDRVKNDDFFGATTFRKGAYPAVSILQNNKEIILKAEIPGFRKEDISIEVNSDIIRLFGERKIDFNPSEVSLHRRERSFGKFDRKLKLPFPIDSKNTKAEYHDGVLNIHLPQSEESKSKQIAIS